MLYHIDPSDYLECNAENFTCAGDLMRFRKKGPNLRLFWQK